MNTQDFIENLITNSSKYKLIKEDENIIRHEGIESFIYRKLNSSKYRSTKTSEDYDQKVRNKVKLCVDQKLPIHISLAFGATKSPYNPTAPNIDWAEVFNIAFVREYLAPIAAAYEHGVILEYISVAVFEEMVNRIPQADTQRYDSQFKQLIEMYQKYLPKGLKINYSRIEDTIPRKVLEERMGKKVEELRQNWEKQDKSVIEEKLFRAKRNCLTDGNEKAIDEILLTSALSHDAFCSESWSDGPPQYDLEDIISLGHRYTKGWAIHIRSAPGSTVNFWSGIGVLVQKNNKFVPTIFSLKQYNEVKEQLRSIPVNIKELSQISSYFNNILIHSESDSK